MNNLLKIAAFLLLGAYFAAAQTPGTAQPPAAGQSPAAAAQAGTDITKPMLEFADTKSAKIAWTSKQSANLGMHYGTDPKNLTGAVDAVDNSGGDNHRATIINLQPNTTYYVQMTTMNGQPVGPIYSFKTPAQGAQPIHQQPLNPSM